MHGVHSFSSEGIARIIGNTSHKSEGIARITGSTSHKQEGIARISVSTSCNKNIDIVYAMLKSVIKN